MAFCVIGTDFFLMEKTHLFNLLDWPSGNSGQLVYLNQKLNTFDENKSLKKLKEVMSYLNVVIPWEIDELVGLVNERGKVTLSYASIEEIIDSCLLEPVDDYDEMGMMMVDLTTGKMNLVMFLLFQLIIAMTLGLL